MIALKGRICLLDSIGGTKHFSAYDLLCLYGETIKLNLQIVIVYKNTQTDTARDVQPRWAKPCECIMQ